MYKPRIIIADTDINYIIPLQLKFIEEFFDKVEFEVITDKSYFEELFSSSQKVDIMIISEELYEASLHRHNIGNIFLMTENYEEESTAELNLNRIFKYTSIKEIMNEIVGKSADIFNISIETKKGTQIILVYSASGGVGNTTISLGISACLTKNYKRVLYINADRLQTFQRQLANSGAITSTEVYSSLLNLNEEIYSKIKHVIRQEIFYYLPPFKSSLMSLGLQYSIYEKIASEAKKSGEYDFIILDVDTCFDEEKAKLLDIADKVIIITRQTEASVYATNSLVSNINGINTDKYIFLCNDFDKNKDNSLISPNINPQFGVSDYIEHFENADKLTIEDLSKQNGIQKATFLII